MPLQRTLRDYTHHSPSVAGFSIDIDLQLMEDAGFSSLQEFKKQICLVGDEMHIKKDLVYDKVSGELIGFVNLGDMTQHLLELEQQLVGSTESTQSLATTVFVFMVRVLFINLKLPMPPFQPSLPQQINFCHSIWKLFFDLRGVVLESLGPHLIFTLLTGGS